MDFYCLMAVFVEASEQTKIIFMLMSGNGIYASNFFDPL